MKRLGITVAALFVSAGLLVAALSSFTTRTARIVPIVPPFDLFWCQKDADCALIDRIGCCPCEQGGAQGAVTEWHRDEFRLFLKSACKPPPKCVQVDMCRTDMTARCVDRRCRMVPKSAGGKAS